jgi:polysaccharide biosynthesis protein PelA
MWRILTALILFIYSTALIAEHTPSIAFYYGAHPPMDELRAYDIAVVDPHANIDTKPVPYAKTQWYAYVSLGEWDGTLPKIFKKNWTLTKNTTWNSHVINQANPQWRMYFINKVIAPLWKKGYHGFFLDTLDSYQLAKLSKTQQRAQEAGLISTITALKKRFPTAHIILNRGFEILPKVKNLINGVAIESLYRSWDQAKKRYTRVSPNDQKWVMARMNTVKKEHLWPIVIDYVSAKNRALQIATAKKIKAAGFIPFVTDGLLQHMGVGSFYIVPRKILVIYDGHSHPDLTFAPVMRFAAFPLEYMGYIPETHDLQKPLPRDVTTGRYAGALIWLEGTPSVTRSKALSLWLSRLIALKVPVTVLGDIGFIANNGQVLKVL